MAEKKPDARRSFDKLLRFLCVGGIGFCVDAAVLVLLTRAGLSAYLARMISLACSISLTWILNRHFSFGVSSYHAAFEYGRYAIVAMVAAAVNYGVYALCLTQTTPLVAMVAGSAAAILLTFTGYDRWVFVRRAKH
jgi:putative flippase GtrA